MGHGAVDPRMIHRLAASAFACCIRGQAGDGRLVLARFVLWSSLLSVLLHGVKNSISLAKIKLRAPNWWENLEWAGGSRHGRAGAFGESGHIERETENGPAGRKPRCSTIDQRTPKQMQPTIPYPILFSAVWRRGVMFRHSNGVEHRPRAKDAQHGNTTHVRVLY